MLEIEFIRYSRDKRKTVLVDVNGKSYTIKKSPVWLLKKMVCLGGSSYEGRLKSFKQLTNSVQKPCVLVNERKGTIYIPTTKDTNKECYWLNYNDIFDYKSKGNGTAIYFSNGVVVEVPVDRRVIKKQMDRCQQFMTLLKQNTLINVEADKISKLYK